jgi:proton-translocating NADH-quinone oxidoreductase chain N
MDTKTMLILFLCIPLGAAPLVYLAGRLYMRSNPQSHRNPAGWLALLALLADALPLFFLGGEVLSDGGVNVTLGSIHMQFDGLALLLSVVVLTLSALATLYSITYMQGDSSEEKFFALLLIMAGSMTGLSCTADLFNLWVWFEVMSIASAMLVAFYRDQPASLEAGVKYLVQSAVGSALVVLGIALVYAQAGTLDLDSLRTAIDGPSSVMVAAGALFIIGFGVKAAFVPMHTWLPDAHSQAPSGISALLSGVVIEAGLVAMLRSLGALAGSGTAWGGLLLGFGAVNMLLGNLMALRQTQVKRLLAYSSISHMGYMLLGFGAAIAFGQTDGAAGGFFHLVTHMLGKGLAFLCVGALLYALFIARGKHTPLTLNDLNGASQRYPLVTLTFSIALLSLGGLPPLAGFMSKWQIFVASVSSQNLAGILLVVFAATNSVLSLAYYAPLVNRMYRREPSPAVQNGATLTPLLVIPLLVLTVLVVALGLWPPLVSWLTGPAAASLLAVFRLK